jgi:hypothetical protein
MWDITEKRITKEKVRRTATNAPAMESMMEYEDADGSKLSVMEKSRSPRRILGAWCPAPRPTGKLQQAIHHANITTTLKSLVLNREKGI